LRLLKNQTSVTIDQLQYFIVLLASYCTVVANIPKMSGVILICPNFHVSKHESKKSRNMV